METSKRQDHRAVGTHSALPSTIGKLGPMRSSVQDTPFQFRANAGLLSAARAKADREGMTLSELVRSALRREIAHADL